MLDRGFRPTVMARENDVAEYVAELILQWVFLLPCVQVELINSTEQEL